MVRAAKAPPATGEDGLARILDAAQTSTTAHKALAKQLQVPPTPPPPREVGRLW